MPGPGRGFLSLYTLSWLTGLMWKACRGKVKPDDIWTLRVRIRKCINIDTYIAQPGFNTSSSVCKYINNYTKYQNGDEISALISSPF